MFRLLMLLMILGASAPGQVLAGDPPSELAPMVVPLDEVEAMLADGTFVDGEFSNSVGSAEAASFGKTIQNRLRTAKAEYTRLPRAIRTSKEADVQWYRMDGLIKLSEGFSAALQRHAQRVAAQNTPSAQGTTIAPTRAPAPAQPVDPAVAARKQAADARAAVLRAQQAEIEARAAAVAAEKQAAAEAKATGVEPTGDDWRNSYIPNIRELESRDGFFQWPWSQPSWASVLQKAEAERAKNALGSTQVERFRSYVLDRANGWPAVPRVTDAGDAEYALDMIRERELAEGLKVVDLWISRSDWKIQRNALGVIESRSKPGYLLYKDPSGQGCILKQLWIQEPYAGGDRYEQVSSWRYADLRFQACDRR